MARYFTFTTIILSLSLFACISRCHILVRRDDNSTTDPDTTGVSPNQNAQPEGESRFLGALLGPMMGALGPMLGGAGSAIMGTIGQAGQAIMGQATQAIGGAIQSGIQSAIQSAIGSVGQAVTDQISQGASSMVGNVMGGMMGGGGGGGGGMGRRKKRSLSRSQVFNVRSSQNSGISELRSRRHVSMKTLVDSPYDFKNQASFRTTGGLKNHRLELIETRHHIKN